MHNIERSSIWRLRRPILLCAFVLVSVNALADYRTDWVEKMQPITPRSYLCQYTTRPIKIDGLLNDPAWSVAPWTSNFVDIQGRLKPKPRFRTRVKMLWDKNYLYIAAQLEEPDVWATLTKHDSVIFRDPDFEVFMNPNGETQPYYEFEMNALNTTWDLRLNKPYIDQGKPDNSWEIPGAKTAVHVNGTINHPGDVDRGWTVEIAFPWKVLSKDARHSGPPVEGEQWRINFSRVEWHITTTNGIYKKVPNVPEDNWVWSPQGVVDMHRPEMWGVVQFAGQPTHKTISIAPISGKPARDLALEIYYAEKDFWNAHQCWTTNLAKLDVSPGEFPPGVRPPVIKPTTDGYACSVAFYESSFRSGASAERRKHPARKMAALDRDAATPVHGPDARPMLEVEPRHNRGVQHVWRIRQDGLLKLDQPMPVETDLFIARAAKKFGGQGRRAARFLVANMPAEDRAMLGSDFLMRDLALAFEARTNFPWAAAVPERIFLNDVLPYASLDEPRDPWRTDFYRIASEIVRNCTNATDAAQTLNRELFHLINVHYSLARQRANQSPDESMEQHRASCTGLSIILVDACRAVGVPARIAGVPEWSNQKGNHTWVEFWNHGWYFMGADEYDQRGPDHAWFVHDAALTARSSNPLNQIYASSWRRTGHYFPLAWNLESHTVPGVDVSARYAALKTSTNAATALRKQAQ